MGRKKKHYTSKRKQKLRAKLNIEKRWSAKNDFKQADKCISKPNPNPTSQEYAVIENCIFEPGITIHVDGEKFPLLTRDVGTQCQIIGEDLAKLLAGDTNPSRKHNRKLRTRLQVSSLAPQYENSLKINQVYTPVLRCCNNDEQYNNKLETKQKHDTQQQLSKRRSENEIDGVTAEYEMCEPDSENSIDIKVNPLKLYDTEEQLVKPDAFTSDRPVPQAFTTDSQKIKRELITDNMSLVGPVTFIKSELCTSDVEETTKVNKLHAHDTAFTFVSVSGGCEDDLQMSLDRAESEGNVDVIYTLLAFEKAENLRLQELLKVSQATMDNDQKKLAVAEETIRQLRAQIADLEDKLQNGHQDC